jgi:hypothetical protein
MRCRAYLASGLFAFALLSRVVFAQQPLKEPSKPSTNPKAATADTGTISGGAYRNAEFRFTYKIPFGWVNRTQEMSVSEDSNDGSTPDSAGSKKSVLLLGVFERPPESTGDSVNSAVVIAAEPASSYPGLRTPEQYFGPLTELTKAKGLSVVNEPYDFPVGAMQLVRGDFSKPIGKLTMRQSTLVMIEKGYVVSLTFIGGSEDEVEQLVGYLSFDRRQSASQK